MEVSVDGRTVNVDTFGAVQLTPNEADALARELTAAAEKAREAFQFVSSFGTPFGIQPYNGHLRFEIGHEQSAFLMDRFLAYRVAEELRTLAERMI